MKSNSKSARTVIIMVVVALVSALLVVGIVSAQNQTIEQTASVTTAVNEVTVSAPSSQVATDDLMVASFGTAKISMNDATGVVRFASFPQGLDGFAMTESAEAQADAFLAEYGVVFGIRDAAAELSYVNTIVDQFGFSHVNYVQVHDSVNVYASTMRVHFNADGKLTAVNGTFIPKIVADSTHKLSAAQAADIAIAAVSGQRASGIVAQFAASQAEAVNNNIYYYHTGLLQSKTGNTVLVYEVEVSNGFDIREFVFVDANNGTIVEQITGIHEGGGADREVSETSLANVVWDESNGDPDPIPGGWAGGTVQQVIDWNNEIDGAKETYNVIDNLTGGTYSSYDGAEATMRTVNNDPGISCPNANWNGISTNYCTGVTGDDTVAHEWGHAYTEYTHNLVYAWQPGALNESYSDIWGEIVDLVNGRGTDAPGGLRSDGGCSVYGQGSNEDDSYRWLSGEDDPAFGGSIRDMWTPTCYGDPGKVTDTQYWCQATDGGGVHTNSGVPNHAFALLVDGGTYNSQTITGIGLDKAAHIYWRAQSIYQSVATDFPDHASSLAASCSDLTGVATLTALSATSTPGAVIPAITAGDCAELDKIIIAVEFNTPPDQCGFEPAFVTAPALCDGQGNGTVTSIYTQTWEIDMDGWVTGTHDVALPSTFTNPDWVIRGSLPDGRGGNAMYVEDSINRGACTPTDTVAGALNLDTPVFTVPAGITVTRVAIDHLVSTESGWDGGNVKINVNGGGWVVLPDSAFEVNGYFAPGAINGGGNDNPLAGEEGFTGGGEGAVSTGWGQSQLNLSPYVSSGDNYQLRFDMGLDGCNGVDGWYIDEFEVYACEEEAPGANCGDGVLDMGETCDDANTDNGDGCSDICQVESGWTCEDPVAGDPNGTNAVGDWSFEAGAPGNPYWTESSTYGGIAGFPFCGPGCPAAGVTNTGDWAVWIGGLADGVTSHVTQTINIPATSTDLTVYTLRGVCDAITDTLHISLDGSDVGTVACDDTDGAYVQQTFSVAGYNDGSDHMLDIGGTVGGTNGTHSNLFVDDVTIFDNVPTADTPSVCTPDPVDWACNTASAGFENGVLPTNWTISTTADAGGEFVVSMDNSSGFWDPGPAPEGSYYASANDDLPGGGSDGSADYLYTDIIDLSSVISATMDFQYHSNGDYGHAGGVEVSGDGGATWDGETIVPSGGDWQSYTLNLDAYAGNANVMVRFHSDDGGAWAAGYAVDNVGLTCEIPASLSCNGPVVGFEDGMLPGDWYTETLALPGGEFVVSMDNSSGFWDPGAAPEGSYYLSANDDLPGSGSDGSADYAYTGIIDMSGYNAASLDFQYHYNGAYSHIGGVEVSGDGGSTWDGETVLPSGDNWQSYSLDLGAYAGNSNVRVRFHSDDAGAWAAGFAVDAVSATCAAGSPPEIVVDPTSMASTQASDSTVMQTLTISNTGGADLDWTIEEANTPVASSRNVATVAGDDKSGTTRITIGDNDLTVSSLAAGTSATPQGVVHAPTATTLTHSASQAITSGNSVSCNDGANHTDNSYIRTFDLTAFGITGDFDVTDVEFGVETATGATGSQPITVNIYTMIDPIAPLTFANLALIGTTATTVADQTLSLFNVPVTGMAPAGSVLVVEVFTPEGQTDGHTFFVGSNADGQTAPTFLAAADCSISEPTDTAAIGFAGMHVVMNVTGDEGASNAVCDSPGDIPWVSVSPMSGTTTPMGGDAVDVTFDSTGMMTGVYTGTLCIDSNDAVTPLVEVPLTMTVEIASDPEIVVTPALLVSTQDQDTSVMQTVTISNTGNADLTWTIAEATGTFAAPLPVFMPALQADMNSRAGSQVDTTLPVAYVSQADFSEGFDDITNLPGWAMDNNSDSPGTADWFQGNSDVFSAHAGAATAYMAVNFNSTAGTQISNWLMTPELNFTGSSSISFWTRTATGSNYPDRLQIRVSTAGASVDAGSGVTDVGDFTNLELDINDTVSVGGYPDVWTQYTVDLSAYAGQSGRVAFHYYVPTDAGPTGNNSNYIGIDTIEYVEGSGGSGSACDSPSDIPWVNVSPMSGTTTPMGGDAVDVTFDSTGMMTGVYTGTLCINSNDAITPLVEVPLTMTVETGISYIYLPVIMTPPGKPDIVLSGFAGGPDYLELMVKNQGTAATDTGFWVDLYINPVISPTGVNQTWETNGGEGMVWGVTESLAPGESVTLTLSSAYYAVSESNFSGTITAGSSLYIQVDATGDPVYGGILESDETNNITHISSPPYDVTPVNIVADAMFSEVMMGLRP